MVSLCMTPKEILRDCSVLVLAFAAAAAFIAVVIGVISFACCVVSPSGGQLVSGVKFTNLLTVAVTSVYLGARFGKAWLMTLISVRFQVGVNRYLILVGILATLSILFARIGRTRVEAIVLNTVTPLFKPTASSSFWRFVL